MIALKNAATLLRVMQQVLRIYFVPAVRALMRQRAERLEVLREIAAEQRETNRKLGILVSASRGGVDEVSISPDLLEAIHRGAERHLRKQGLAGRR